MNNGIDRPKKMLTREEILKVDTPCKVYTLPSGQTVNVKYLAIYLAREIRKSCESETRGNIERIFSEKVIKYMLRENEQKDLYSFSKEDQQQLIEIAVQEWGCEKEYESLKEIQNPEIRFYKAVSKQEEELTRQLLDGFKAIFISQANFIFPFKTFQSELASSLERLFDQCNVASQVTNAINKINMQAIDQIMDISKLMIPINSIAGEIAAIQSSTFLPFEKYLLENVHEMMSSYQSLMKDVLPVERFAVLPDSVRYYPTVEMYNTSIITGRLATKEINQPDDELIAPDENGLLEWLGRLDPSFPKMMKGAQQTIYSRNLDRCRHFACSHRELGTLILHKLAPDHLVEKWIDDPNYYCNGRPTRNARLKYVARNHKNKTFVDFLIKDFVNQMSLLNADEHRDNQYYSDQELILLHIRFLSTLGFIKQVVTSCSS